jgi:hypothetical protein
MGRAHEERPFGMRGPLERWDGDLSAHEHDEIGGATVLVERLVEIDDSTDLPGMVRDLETRPGLLRSTDSIPSVVWSAPTMLGPVNPGSLISCARSGVTMMKHDDHVSERLLRPN